MARRIDVDRGVMIRKDHKFGIEVFMYKDTPGVFLDAHGKEVSAALAKRAGYDIERLITERKIAEAKKKAFADIEAQFRQEGAAHGPTVVKETDSGYKLVDLGMNRHNVVSPDGAKMNSSYLTKHEGVALLTELDQAVQDVSEQVKEAEAEAEAEEAEAEKKGIKLGPVMGSKAPAEGAKSAKA